MTPRIAPVTVMNDGFAATAWWVAGVVAILLFLLLIQILVLRGILAVRRKRAKRFREVWEPVLARCVTEVPADIPSLSHGRVADLLLLWNYMQESVRDESKERLNEVARRLGLNDGAAEMVLHGDVAAKLVALTALGHMRDRILWDRMRELLLGDDAVISLCAARALIRIDASEAAQIVIDQVAVRADWPTATVAGILREAGPDAISEPLGRAASDADDTAAPRLIRLLELAHSEISAPVVRTVLSRTSSIETITACLRVTNDPALLDQIRDLMEDERWPVRVHATQALGRIGTREDEGLLIRGLCDSEWWVRYRAAQALVALPLIDPDHIHWLSENVSDRYGRDMLRQVIAEEQLAC